MKRAVCGLSVLLAVAVSPCLVWGQASEVVDNREASFMLPPKEILPVEDKKEEPKPEPALAQAEKKEVKPPVASVAPAAAAPETAPATPAQTPPVEAAPTKITPPPPVKTVAPAPKAPAPAPAPSVAAMPAVQSAPPPAPAPAALEPAVLAEPVATAPLADVDPETLGLLSPANGGLGASLWKDTARGMVDRFMPSIGLPTASAALNNLARRMFLTTAAAPYVAANDPKPQRSLLAQRIEALMALGSVSDAWKLASLADAKLVDPVTLRLLTEAAMIGPDSKEVCDKISSMMAAHGKTAETGVEWQKSLLICQLRAGDTKAVQLGLDLMREQKSKDDIFLSIMNKNVLGGSKQLPRQLTPLRPLNLAAIRQLTIPLPPELYARAEAPMIPELLQTVSIDEKARIGLAEKAAQKGIITAAQLAEAYRSLSLTQEDVAQANNSAELSARSRAVAYQAALNEQLAQKKVELTQKFLAGADKTALTGVQGQLAASLLETVPVTAELAANADFIMRVFVLSGKPDKALGWLKLVQQASQTSPEAASALTQNWPFLVLSGLVPDGEYAQGLKAWLTAMLSGADDDGNLVHAKREKAGQVLLILSAAGYAVSEEAWLGVLEGAPPTKQMVSSPILIERVNQVALAGRKGETILLSLLMAGSSGLNEPCFGQMAEIVRALRLVGLTAESQALARELLVAQCDL